VVVVLGAGVVEGGAAGRDEAAHGAELLEQVERRVDRGQRQVRQARFGGPQDLLGGDVPIELDEDPVQQEPLRRDALAALAEALDQLGFGHGRHL
jgi:hypothetical protein